MIDILSSNLNSNFTSVPCGNLVGGLAGRITSEIVFFVHWDTIAKDLTFFGDQIARNDGGDFIIDGFRIGQTIYIEYTGTASSSPNTGEYVIVNISSGVLTVAEITSSESNSELENGTLPFDTEIGTTEYNVHGTTKVQNINFYYGLVENASVPAYISLLDGETQKFTKSNLDADGGNTYELDIASSNRSWLTGTSDDFALTVIEELGTGYTGVSTGFEQAFKVTLPFIISPAFIDTLVDTNGNLAGNLFPQLAGANTLKYVFRFEAGTDNSSVIFNTDNGNINAFLNNGDVGFYDQYRNTSLTPEYSITSIDYADPNGNPVDSLIKNATTSVTIVVNSLNGRLVALDSKIIISVYEIPEDFSDVMNNANTLYENFDVSTKQINDQDPAATNNNISDLTFTVDSANDGVITFDYAAPNLDNSYIIVIEIADPSETRMVASDGMTLLADYREFEYQVDLSEIYSSENGISVNEHSSNDIERSFTDYKGWIEDGVLFTNLFSISALGGYDDELEMSLRNVKVKIEVENSTDSSRNFTLEEFTLLPPNEDEGRTYLLPTGDPKNYLYITEDSVTISNTDYTVKYATKLRWETWFTQANADPDFSPATKDWSEYITGDWSVKMNMYFSLDGIDSNTGDRYNFEVKHGVDIGIKYYDEYDGCANTGIIETFHQPTMTDLGGSLSRTENTFVRATFYGKKLFPCAWQVDENCDYTQIISGSGSGSDSNGELDGMGCQELYGILELDDEQSGGIAFIRQISSMYDPETDTPWIGESGVRAKLTHYPFATNPCSILEAVLDIDQLDLTRNYKLSARIGGIAQTICDVAIFYHLRTAVGTYSNSDINGFTEAEILVFSFNGSNYNVRGIIASVTGNDITLTGANKFLDSVKIVCAVNRIDDTKSSGTYMNASLIGLDICDFFFFAQIGGIEITSDTSLYVFNSGTGEISYSNTLNGSILIDFRESFICDDVVAITSYTDSSLVGLSLNQILVFCAGQEQVALLNVTLSGDTLTFINAVTGKLKVALVNG